MNNQREFKLREQYETRNKDILTIVGVFVEYHAIDRVYYTSETKESGLIDNNGTYFLSTSCFASNLIKLK